MITALTYVTLWKIVLKKVLLISLIPEIIICGAGKRSVGVSTMLRLILTMFSLRVLSRPVEYCFYMAYHQRHEIKVLFLCWHGFRLTILSK